MLVQEAAPGTFVLVSVNFCPNWARIWFPDRPEALIVVKVNEHHKKFVL
jgi:hypothetical protein